MIRGTTPTHIFTLPFDVGSIKDIWISYGQDNRIVVEKRYNDCSFNEREVSVRLEQEDTLKFTHTENVQIQLKVMTHDNNVIASGIKNVNIDAVLNDEVMR